MSKVSRTDTFNPIAEGKNPNVQIIPDDTLQIYHVNEIGECSHGCGTPIVQIEGILATGGMRRITCEAVADVELGAIRLKVHIDFDCPKIRGNEAEM